mgnify:CR=1 FL=1
MKDRIAELVELYRKAIDAEIDEEQARREAQGCVHIVQMCGLVKRPDRIPLALQHHIAACHHCRPLYEEFLKTYPNLTRPAWLDSPPDCADSTALVKKEGGVPARREDVEPIDFRPLYLRPLDFIKRFMGDLFGPDESKHGD